MRSISTGDIGELVIRFGRTAGSSVGSTVGTSSFAIPKSRSFGIKRPAFAWIMMFAGLMSR